MTADQEPQGRHPLGLRSLIPFLAITFGLAWGIIGLYVFAADTMVGLFGQISGSHPLFYLAVYAPALAALAVVARTAGLRGVTSFLRRALLWRAPVTWYAFLLVGVPALFLAGAALGKGVAFDASLFSSIPSLVGVLLLAAIKGPIEEFGWRGFALPLLQRRMAPVWAGLVIGVVWGFWHLPAFLLSGTQQSQWSFGTFFLGCIALSVIATSLYNASRGSILLAALFHFQLMNPILPDAQPWDTYLFLGVAALIVWRDRKAMLHRPGAETVVISSEAGGFVFDDANSASMIDRPPVVQVLSPHTEKDTSMRSTRSTARRSAATCASLLGLLVASLAATPLQAQGWQFTAGGGMMGEGVYTGSDDHYVAPLPTFDATYASGRASFTISLTEGLGFTWVEPDRGLMFSLGVNAGEERHREYYSVAAFDVDHSDRTRRLLEQSPNLSTPVATTATLATITPVGLIGLSVGYHPTTVESALPGVADRVGHGWLASISHMVELPVTSRLSVASLLGLEVMNGTYAETWYSVDQPTAALPAYSAGAGLRDAQVALQLTYGLSDRVDLSLLGVSFIMLGDAHESPYTVERIARSMSLETSYRF